MNSLINTSAYIRSILITAVSKEIEGVRNQLFVQKPNPTNVSITPYLDNDESSSEDRGTLALLMETRKRKSEAMSSAPQPRSNNASVPIEPNLYKDAASYEYGGTLAQLMKQRSKCYDVISSTLQSE